MIFYDCSIFVAAGWRDKIIPVDNPDRKGFVVKEEPWRKIKGNVRGNVRGNLKENLKGNLKRKLKRKLKKETLKET